MYVYMYIRPALMLNPVQYHCWFDDFKKVFYASCISIVWTVCFTICSEERPLGELGEILEPNLHDLGFVRLRQCTSLSVYDVSTCT